MMKIFLFMCFFLVFCSQSFAAKPPVKNPSIPVSVATSPGISLQIADLTQTLCWCEVDPVSLLLGRGSQ
jgi:hypothetical protein